MNGWGKTGGRTYKHFVHSYHEDEHITPEQAHKNAIELAKGTEAWKVIFVLQMCKNLLIRLAVKRSKGSILYNISK